MSIFRCSKCAYIKEVSETYIDKMAKCPKCKSENRVVDTISFIQKIILAYSKKQNEINQYKAKFDEFEKKILNLKKQNSTFNNKYSKILNQNKKFQDEIVILKEKLKTSKLSSSKNSKIVDNISHSKEFNNNEDHQLIIDWYTKNNMSADIDLDSIDTKGFFDEVAITLGNNFHVLESVLEQIRYIQKKGYDTVKIVLDNKSKEDIDIIKSFCKEIYDYSFASRYFYDKKKNAIYIEIQKATKIVNFFNGIWMEWYIYMMLLELFETENFSYNLIKGLKVTYANNDKNELDIFFIVDNTPVCIECKSGEFRKDIDKYLRLKKRLRLKKEHFIICAIGLDTMQTDGLTYTYDITFTNQSNILEHINNILHKIKRVNKVNEIKKVNKVRNISKDKNIAKKSGFLSGFMSSLKK